jgi:hypothetical protein
MICLSQTVVAKRPAKWAGIALPREGLKTSLKPFAFVMLPRTQPEAAFQCSC